MEFPHRDLYFTKRERQGLYFMLACIVLLILAILAFKFTYEVEPYQFSEVELHNIQNFDIKQKKLKEKEKQKVTKKAFNFDPNTTPLDSLLILPIPNSIANRIDKYRKKGGKYESKSDLKKIYGISYHWDKIKDFVIIPNANSSLKNESKIKGVDVELYSTNQLKSQKKDSMSISENNEHKITSTTTDTSQKQTSYPKSLKLEGEDRIEINSANEYNIQLVYGIGEYYAKKIIDYKDKTGGFHSLYILHDIGLKKEAIEKILPQLTCDPSKINKQNINTLPYENLALLPGIGYKKATILQRYIRNHFPLTDSEDLRKVGIFKNQEVDVLLLYLKFED